MITALIVSVVFLLVFGWLFVRGMRKLGNTGVKLHEDNWPRSNRCHPNCNCYMTSAMGISTPRLVRGRTCEMYFMNEGRWPEWCRGPKG